MAGLFDTPEERVSRPLDFRLSSQVTDLKLPFKKLTYGDTTVLIYRDKEDLLNTISQNQPGMMFVDHRGSESTLTFLVNDRIVVTFQAPKSVVMPLIQEAAEYGVKLFRGMITCDDSGELTWLRFPGRVFE